MMKIQVIVPKDYENKGEYDYAKISYIDVFDLHLSFMGCS